MEEYVNSVLDIVCSSLNVDPSEIDLECSLHDLGAHSLLIVQWVHEIEDRHGIRLTIRDMFFDPTVSGLAKAIYNDKNKQIHDRV
ncbi:MAG: acyl carrier protein [Arenicella sp.]|jgi:acyl carrier protein